jgi:hypothetical protein
MKPFSKSVWISPAACGASAPMWVVRAHFLDARGEERQQAEQVVRRTDHAVESRFVQPEFFQEREAVAFVELRDLRFDRRAHRHDVRAFGRRTFVHCVQVRIVLEAALGHVGHVHQRLDRDQVVLAQQGTLGDRVERQRARRLARVEVILHALQQVAQAHGVLVARLGVLLGAAVGTLDGVEVGEREFGIDDVDVADRVDLAGDVHDVVVDEAAHHVRDRSVRGCAGTVA